MSRIEQMDEVVQFMKRAHGDQKRKQGTPYFEHPLAVAVKLEAAWPECPNWLLQAALLHDVLEDTRVTFPDLHKRFGTTTAGTVELLTKPVARYLRNIRYYVRISLCRLEIRLLKLVDRTHNLEDYTIIPLEDEGHYPAISARYLNDMIHEEEIEQYPHAALIVERYREALQKAQQYAQEHKET